MTMVIESEPAKYTFPIKITNPFERETWTVSTDHCYARPWNWKPESSFLKPTKSLFIPKNINYKSLFASKSLSKGAEDAIDVESAAEAPDPNYDIDKAKNLMDECEKHASLARNSIDDENWEERIIKTNWSPSQHRLFNGFVNILNNFYLGKMAYSGLKNEPVLRRTIIDKAVQRVRRLFNTVSYDAKLLQWLHQLLLDNLDQQNLSSYLDILQTLRSKVPTFLEKLLNTPTSANRMGPLNNENLLPLLKKPWDPVEFSLQQDKPNKLPNNPVIVLIPCSPSMTKRTRKWMTLLSNLGQVVTVPTNFGSASHRMTMTSSIDQMFALARGRIQEVRENHPGRHIILVGAGAGATLALQVAQVENVFCVISLGFSMLTAEGRRGEPDDSLLELQCPVLFVIGQCSSTSFQEDMEDLRERMRIETGLIVVGSADNNLIVNKKKKREEGITQSIVDRCIIDEIGEFISTLILSPYPPQIRQSPTNIPAETPMKKGKLERKRFNSNTSSIESEPPSPTPRVTRPVGRPAGKSKCKLEAKWAAQVAQGTTTSANIILSTSTSSLSPTHLTSADINPTTPSSSDTASASESSPHPPSIPTSPLKAENGNPAAGTRKLRTLKPVADKISKQQSGEQGGSDQGQLSTLLQGGIKTIPPQKQTTGPSPSTTIKVLENVQLSSQATAKLITNSSGRTIDLSKIGLGPRTPGSNVVLMPDGKIKTVTPSRPITVKGSGGTPIVLSMSGKGITRKAKFITSKKLPTTTTPLKRQNFMQFPQPIKTNLPPPTNLTTQDIMDLPIIFADDNQILDPNMPTDLSTTGSQSQVTIKPEIPPPQPTVPKFIPPTSTSKFVIVNKPAPASGLNNFIITPATVKRPNPVPVTKQPTKYTKIILSKKAVEPLMARIPTSAAISITSVANVPSVEQIDLENELVATAVPKPGLDDDDPDYVPPKNLKL